MSTASEGYKRPIPLGSALLRRGWLLIVCAVAVGLLAYGIAHAQPASYSSEAVLNVPASLGPPSPGSAGGAADLAGSYAALIPRDDRIRSAARAAGAGRGSVSASHRGTTLAVSYTAPSNRAALAGARALVAALTGPRSVSPNVAPGSLQLVHAPTSASHSLLGGGYTARAIFAVPTGAGATQVSADNANKLAVTYSGILPSDDRVIAAVAHATGASPTDVKNNLSVVNEQNTSLLRIQYKASSAVEAVKGARAVAQAVSGPHPVTAAILPSSLQVVSLPAQATSSGVAHDASALVAVGIVLGLALGLVLLVGWERSDPHITQTRELSRRIGCPATPVSRLSTDSAHALLERWTELGDRRPVRVTLLPASESVASVADEIMDYLLDVGGGRVGYEDRRAVPAGNGHGPADVPGDAEVILVRAAPPGGRGAGEAVALDSDVTVLVVPKAMKAAGLRLLADDLGDFGVVPAWALLADRRGFSRRHPVEPSDTHAPAVR